MLKITAATLAFLFCSTALARPFLGVFASAHTLTNTSAELPFIVSVGAQAGVHNLIGPLGVRGTAEVSVYPDFGLSEPLADASSYRLTEVAADALASLSFVSVTGYVGVGGGVGTIFSVDALQVRGVAGVELGGLFVEALPTYWLRTESGLGLYDLRARAGFNLGF